MQYMPGQKGMTLPELLITLSITAILMSVAAPSMRSLIASQRVSSIAQDVYGSFAFARSEAVKRRSPISICHSVNGSFCHDNGDDWGGGWLVFTDADSDGTLETGDTLIRVFEALPEVVGLQWNRGANAGFNSKGHARKAGTFTLCEQGASDTYVREIILSLTGRMRVAERGSC